MKRHYAVRPFSVDTVQVDGHLDVHVSWPMRMLSRLTGMLVSYSGKNVPVSVVFRSDPAGGFQLDRTFHFPDQGQFKFLSSMQWVGQNELIEFMRFGFGWKLAYEWEAGKAVLRHRGYVWRFLGFMIPVPLALVIGRGHAEEEPLTDDRFQMWMYVKHPLFGVTFSYSGTFKITQVLAKET